MDREAVAAALLTLCPRDEDGGYRAGWLAAAEAVRQLQLDPPEYVTLADIARQFDLSGSTPATWLARHPGHCSAHESPSDGCGWCMIAVQRKPPVPDAVYGPRRSPLWLVSRLPSWRVWRNAWSDGTRPRRSSP